MYNSAKLSRERLGKSCEVRGEKARIRRETGLSASQIDRYIDGSNVPSLDKLDLLAGALDEKPWRIIAPAPTPSDPHERVADKLRKLPADKLLAVDALISGLLIQAEAERKAKHKADPIP